MVRFDHCGQHCEKVMNLRKGLCFCVYKHTSEVTSITPTWPVANVNVVTVEKEEYLSLAFCLCLSSVGLLNGHFFGNPISCLGQLALRMNYVQLYI